MKVYISGAISGVLEEEYTTAFGRAEALLLSEDYEPVNPLKVVACIEEDCSTSGETKSDGSYLHSWQCYMRHDIKAMLDCDAIAMIPDWETSKGAALEKQVAQKCGMQIMWISRDFKRVMA